MIDSPGFSRRAVFRLLLRSTLMVWLARRAGAGPLDQGIGGTGIAPLPPEESDRGIGGTGVIGTIQKFGSIVVNDLRIAYPVDAAVRIDGRPATVADLRIGQVVRVAAGGAEGTYLTHAIDVTHEVVGPLERLDGGHATVLGQAVVGPSKLWRGMAPGSIVAVSGLRRNDGTVAASLVEHRPTGTPSQIVGPVDVAGDGSLRIGGTRLLGLDPDLIGRRVLVRGQAGSDGFAVSHAASESSLLPHVRTVSIEGYVERRGADLRFGSGLVANGGTAEALPSGRSIRAVVTGTVEADGTFRVEQVRGAGRVFGARDGGGPRGGTPDRGGGGPAGEGGAGRDVDRSRHGPMDFGRPDRGGGGMGGFGGGPMGGPGGGGPGGPGGGGFGGRR